VIADPQPIEGRSRELIEAPNFCHVSTLNPSGSIHAALVWIDVDGDHLVLNSADGRIWPRNLRLDPRCQLLVANRKDQYELVSIKALLAEETKDGADAQIEKMARKYLDDETYPAHVPGIRGEGMVRVTFRLAAERVAYRPGPGPRVDERAS
jgi:PPOX class probable F420-dependent enzyme